MYVSEDDDGPLLRWEWISPVQSAQFHDDFGFSESHAAEDEEEADHRKEIKNIFVCIFLQN